ncbi:MAG: LbtU family siderophore porin [Gammaproteobacteria bacterium]|nr:LbtU family siderophore porin [Gammaproteobacteria bacterium]
MSIKLRKQICFLVTLSISGVGFSETAGAQQEAPQSETLSFYQSTLQHLNQSFDHADVDLHASDEWAKYVDITGGFYVDAKAGDQTYNAQGENTHRLSVTDAYLKVSATPNSWTRLTAVSNYSGASTSYGANPDKPEETDNTVYIDQIYATFGDEARSPVFAQVGKQYLPFGQYNVYPVVKPLGQVLTQTNATDAQVGFIVPEGLYGTAYVFQNPVSSDGLDETMPYNGGVALGFKKNYSGLDVDLGMSYINNMSAVDAIANYIEQETVNEGYGSSVSALAPYASFQQGPFGFIIDYVSALSTFDQSTLPYDLNSKNGAKPSALDAQASYAFNYQ